MYKYTNTSIHISHSHCYLFSFDIDNSTVHFNSTQCQQFQSLLEQVENSSDSLLGDAYSIEISCVENNVGQAPKNERLKSN